MQSTDPYTQAPNPVDPPSADPFNAIKSAFSNNPQQSPTQTPRSENQANQYPPRTEADYYNGYAQTEFFPGINKPMPEELVYEWQAPSRPFKKHSRQFHMLILLIAMLISIILFFAGQLLPIVVVISIVFLMYVLSSIPPHTILIQFTTYGIRYESEIYYWEELGRFWFDEKYGETLIHIEVARFPNRLTLLTGTGNQGLIVDLLSEVLLQEKPPLTAYEKMARWLNEMIPLDIDR